MPKPEKEQPSRPKDALTDASEQDAHEALDTIAQIPSALTHFMEGIFSLDRSQGVVLPIRKNAILVGYRAIIPFQYDPSKNLVQRVFAGQKTITGELVMTVDYQPYLQLKEGRTPPTEMNRWGDLNIVRDKHGYPMPAFQSRMVEFSSNVKLTDGSREQVYSLRLPSDLEGAYVSAYVTMREEKYDYEYGWHHPKDTSTAEVQMQIQRILDSILNCLLLGVHPHPEDMYLSNVEYVDKDLVVR